MRPGGKSNGESPFFEKPFLSFEERVGNVVARPTRPTRPTREPRHVGALVRSLTRARSGALSEDLPGNRAARSSSNRHAMALQLMLPKVDQVLGSDADHLTVLQGHFVALIGLMEARETTL